MQNRDFKIQLKYLFKSISKHWSPIAFLIGTLGTLLSLSTLYTYLDTIGRPDIFPAALTSGTALAAWLITIVGTLIILIFLIVLTTLLFSFSMSVFNRIDNEEKSKLVWRLSLPIFAGLISLHTFTFFLYKTVPPSIAIPSVAIFVFIVLYLVTSLSKTFKHCINSQLERTHKEIKETKYSLYGTVFICLLSAVFSGIYIIQIILKFYTGEETNQTLYYLTALSLAALLISVLPVIVFYRSKGKLKRKLLFSFIMLIIAIGTPLFLVPGMLKSLSYSAAANFNFRDNSTRTVLLTNGLSVDDFPQKSWRAASHTSTGVEIETLILFSFGNVLLLCPPDLPRQSIYKLAQHTQSCFPADRQSVIFKPTIAASIDPL